jgi:hypothetical protein
VFSVFSLSLISCFAYQKQTIIVFVQQNKRKTQTILTVSHNESLIYIMKNLTISMCLLRCTLCMCGVLDPRCAWRYPRPVESALHISRPGKTCLRYVSTQIAPVRSHHEVHCKFHSCDFTMNSKGDPRTTL